MSSRTRERDRLARDNRKLDRLLSQAQLRIANAHVEDVDDRAPRGLDKSTLRQLVACAWGTAAFDLASLRRNLSRLELCRMRSRPHDAPSGLQGDRSTCAATLRRAFMGESGRQLRANARQAREARSMILDDLGIGRSTSGSVCLRGPCADCFFALVSSPPTPQLIAPTLNSVTRTFESTPAVCAA